MSARTVILISLATPFAACTSTQPPPQTQDVSSEIRVANQGFTTAFAQQDAATLASLYTMNAQLLPPNSDFVDGQAAIETFWQGVMDAGVAAASLTTEEAIGLDSLAYEVGRYALADSAGGAIDAGKYIVIWKRTPNGWRLHRDIWNSSMASM